MKKQKIIIGGLVILCLSLIVWHLWPEGQAVQGATRTNSTVDIVGTRVGTTTTGVQFLPSILSTATSTHYASSTGSITSAQITLKAVAASSTAVGPKVYLSIFGSNDFNCRTSTTSASANQFEGQLTVVMNDINWYDIGPHFSGLENSSGTLSTGTSTIDWTPLAGQSLDIELTNLDYQCLKFEVRASSTQLFIQGKFGEDL